MTGRLTRAFTTRAKRASLLVALVVVGAVLGLLGLALGTQFVALVGLLLAVTAAGALAASLLVSSASRTSGWTRRSNAFRPSMRGSRTS